MSFVYDISERYYKPVPASSVVNFDYIPADGEKVFIVNAGISSSSVPDTLGCIVWDPDGTPEVIMSSYGEAVNMDINITLIGDGVIPIRVCLRNDLTQVAYLGAFWQGMKL